MKESLYLDRFQQLSEKSIATLRGDWMLVEFIPKEEKKTASGIYMPTDSMSSAQVNGVAPERKLTFVRVLFTGEGYDEVDDEGNKIKEALEYAPGDIVAIPFTAIKWFSDFGDMVDYKQDTIGLAQAAMVQWHLGSEDNYTKVFDVLNGEDDDF